MTTESQDLSFTSHPKDVSPVNTVFEVNMKSKWTLCMLVLHVPGPIVYDSSMHVIPKKTMFVFIIFHLPLHFFILCCHLATG